MTNFLDETADDLFDLLSDEDEAGRTVSIVQSNGNTIAEVPVTLDLAEYEIDDRMGIPIKMQSFDWTVKKSSLGTSKLRNGDVVEYENGTITERYELMPIGTSKPSVEPRDAAGTVLVLHTKQVEVDV